MTVKELANLCQEQVKQGLGDKEVWISNDIEGNGFHMLYYSFEDDQNAIEENYFDEEPNDIKNIILLG